MRCNCAPTPRTAAPSTLACSPGRGLSSTRRSWSSAPLCLLTVPSRKGGIWGYFATGGAASLMSHEDALCRLAEAHGASVNRQGGVYVNGKAYSFTKKPSPATKSPPISYSWGDDAGQFSISCRGFEEKWNRRCGLKHKIISQGDKTHKSQIESLCNNQKQGRGIAAMKTDRISATCFVGTA